MGRTNIRGLGLDRIVFQNIVTRDPITLRLPVPPSVNACWANVPGVGRVKTDKYRKWEKEAAATLWQQKRQFIAGPVSLSLIVSDTVRGDLGNYEKACTDFLVHHNFITDDGPKYVREIRLRWGEIEGCEVTIEPIEQRRAA